MKKTIALIISVCFAVSLSLFSVTAFAANQTQTKEDLSVNAETITDLKTIEVLLKEFIKEKGYDATAAVSEETENVEVVFDQQPEGAEEYDIQAVTQAFRDYCSEKQIDYSLVEVSFLLDSPEATITDLKTIEVLLKEFIKEKGYDATAAVSEETENVEVVFDQQPEGAEEYDIQAVTQAFRDYCSEKQIDYSLVEVSFLLDSPEATITTTNTTTADTTDFSDTTEISQNSTNSSAVTTSLSGETETSTTSADLPQTGNNSLRYLLIVLSASVLIGFGMLAVLQSGVIRRRKDGQ